MKQFQAVTPFPSGRGRFVNIIPSSARPRNSAPSKAAANFLLSSEKLSAGLPNVCPNAIMGEFLILDKPQNHKKNTQAL